MIRRFFGLYLLFFFAALHAETKSFDLTPNFNGATKAVFKSFGSSRGNTWKGWLVTAQGKSYALKESCAPEGGDPEVVDAYTVSGTGSYFVFTCRWPVNHPGLGLNGMQYQTFVYKQNSPDILINEAKISSILSGYEGSAEDGGRDHVWYSTKKLIELKLRDINQGRESDSLDLSHEIILTRLKDKDYESIKSYLVDSRLLALCNEYPVSKQNAPIYNDLGYALGEAGDNQSSYKVLKIVESYVPERVVLKLNIADALWTFDREKSIKYYSDYISIMKAQGKGKKIPVRAFERAAMN